MCDVNANNAMLCQFQLMKQCFQNGTNKKIQQYWINILCFFMKSIINAVIYVTPGSLGLSLVSTVLFLNESFIHHACPFRTFTGRTAN